MPYTEYKRSNIVLVITSVTHVIIDSNVVLSLHRGKYINNHVFEVIRHLCVKIRTFTGMYVSQHDDHL